MSSLGIKGYMTVLPSQGKQRQPLHHNPRACQAFTSEAILSPPLKQRLGRLWRSQGLRERVQGEGEDQAVQ